MSASVVTDISKNVIWNARRGDDQSITIDFEDEIGDPYDISGEAFQLPVRRFSGGTVLTLTEGSGITNNGTSINVAFTDTQLDISADVYLSFLKSTNESTGKITTWLNVNFVLNDDIWDGDSTSETTIQVNNGAITLTLQITLGGGSSSGCASLVNWPIASGAPTGTIPKGSRYYLTGSPGTILAEDVAQGTTMEARTNNPTVRADWYINFGGT